MFSYKSFFGFESLLGPTTTTTTTTHKSHVFFKSFFRIFFISLDSLFQINIHTRVKETRISKAEAILPWNLIKIFPHLMTLSFFDSFTLLWSVMFGDVVVIFLLSLSLSTQLNSIFCCFIVIISRMINRCVRFSLLYPFPLSAREFLSCCVYVLMMFDVMNLQIII